MKNLFGNPNETFIFGLILGCILMLVVVCNLNYSKFNQPGVEITKIEKVNQIPVEQSWIIDLTK